MAYDSVISLDFTVRVAKSPCRNYKIDDMLDYVSYSVTLWSKILKNVVWKFYMTEIIVISVKPEVITVIHWLSLNGHQGNIM